MAKVRMARCGGGLDRVRPGSLGFRRSMGHGPPSKGPRGRPTMGPRGRLESPVNRQAPSPDLGPSGQAKMPALHGLLTSAPTIMIIILALACGLPFGVRARINRWGGRIK